MTDEGLLLMDQALSGLTGVVHGFSTRHGGVSPAPRDSLCLALRDGVSESEIIENWTRVSAKFGLTPAAVAIANQVHGARVIRVEEASGVLRTVGDCDGMVTVVPGVLLAIRTADCVPVLLAGPGVVGAAHAGWRGLVADVIGETVATMCDAAGCAASELTASVGPCAGAALYETGSEIPDQLMNVGLPRDQISSMGPMGREHTDLRRAAHLQLERAGVSAIGHIEHCTLESQAFFSHRRDGAQTGRMASLIGLIS